MAQDIVGSLFGVSANDLQAQRQAAAQAQARQYASMDPAQMVNYAGYMAGNQLGGALAGMMGAKDPELEKATKLQQLTSQFDLTSEEGLLNAARTLASNGFQPQAMAMAQRAQEVSLNTAKIGKENALAAKANKEKKDVTDYKMKAWLELAKKSTPESVQKSLDNGHSLADLSVSDNEKRSTTAQKLIEMGLTPGSPEFIKLMREDVEADIRGKGSSRGTTINMPGQVAESAYAKEVGKIVAEGDVQDIKAIQAVSATLPKMYETKKLLKEGKLNTGITADIRTVIDRARSQFLADKNAGKRVTDTEYLDSLLGSEVFGQLQALGVGARGMDTPAEREFMRQVITGTKDLSIDTLNRMIDFRIQSAEKLVKRYNERVQGGELEQYSRITGRPLKPVELPSPTTLSDDDLMNKYKPRK